MAEARSRSIVIAGGGTAGWMTAAALARFAGTTHRITLVESDAIGTVGVGEATIPQIRTFNDALGIDEAEFLEATQGSYKLGIQFDGWTRPDARYMHAFGHLGRPLGIVPFHHYWLAAQAAGEAAPLAAYSLNETAALANRFAHVRPKPGTPVPELPYAFHFDAGLYAAFLRRRAETGGVVRVEGRIAHVVRDGESGGVAALVLEDGRRIAGDLFVDASGFRGLLIEQTLGTGYEDWTHWLPCDRALAVPCERVGETVTPYTRATTRAAGWQWRIPLQHRTGNGIVYCSAHLGDDAAAAILTANLDGAALGDPRPLAFRTGRRRKFWNRNVVAVGLASGFMEPLESTSIHLIQTAIARLIAFLPDGALADAEVDEYNRQTAFEYERIRDFIILHYHANGRDEPFWRDCRAMAIPDTLRDKIEVFRSGGRVFRHDEELFTEPGWVQVMLGQGIVPARHHPLVDAISPAERRDFLASIARVVAGASGALLDHAAYLVEMRGHVAPPSTPMKAIA